MRYLLYTLMIWILPTCAFGQSHHEAEWQVWLKDDATMASILEGYDHLCPIYSTRVNESFNIYKLNSPCKIPGDLITHPAVMLAEKVIPLELRTKEPNDPMYPDQFQMDLIQASRVWDFTTGGTTVAGDEIVVAVLDEQFNEVHNDLVPNLWTNPHEVPDDGQDNDNNGYIDDFLGYNFADDSDNHPVGGSHGTSVTGIVGARGNNGIGVTGVNWEVKVMMLEPIRSNFFVEEAMMYVYDLRKKYNETNGTQGAYVVAVNMSFGQKGRWADTDFPIMCALMDSLGSVGVLCVGAGPNEPDNIDEVGDLPNDCKSEFLISVTNTDEGDNLVGNAGFGPIGIDMSAPGEDSKTTGRDSSYRTFGNCSAAAPYVSGTIALLHSAACEDFVTLSKENPAVAAGAMRAAILQGIDVVPDLVDKTVTGGRLDVWDALEALNNSTCLPDTMIESTIDWIGTDKADGAVTISLTLTPLESHQLELFDMAGRLWKEIDLAPALRSDRVVRLNEANFPVARGAYVARLKGAGTDQSKQFVVVY